MYFNIVKNPFKMLKHPKMAYHFYGVNFYKTAISKYKKRNAFLEKAKKTKIAVGHRFIPNDEFNSIIKEKICANEPFFCCRYGATELTTVFTRVLHREGIVDKISEAQLKRLKTSSGVFPEKEDVYLKFGDEYISAFSEADLNAYWGSLLMEEYVIQNYFRKDCIQYAMRALEPFSYNEPWTMALHGKKVLIVHPFAELIESQYQNRHAIFPDKEILPDCDLVTVKAIQSSGNTCPEGIKDWFEALDILYNRCMEKDFEVALVSCGSYAVPLAAKLKQVGKKVIIPGGMMQLMFGIKGARWEESRPDIVAMYNDAWVRAGETYAVKDSKKMVDGAAYW